jgi:hypothetical protein
MSRIGERDLTRRQNQPLLPTARTRVIDGVEALENRTRRHTVGRLLSNARPTATCPNQGPNKALCTEIAKLRKENEELL